MPKQNIFLVEDNVQVSDALSGFLEESGHLIVTKARSLAEAHEQIPRLLEKGTTVAIIDGNLRLGVLDGQDGKIVIEEIRKLSRSIITISFSMVNHDCGDVFFFKEDIRELIRYISSLP